MCCERTLYVRLSEMDMVSSSSPNPTRPTSLQTQTYPTHRSAAHRPTQPFRLTAKQIIAAVFDSGARHNTRYAVSDNFQPKIVVYFQRFWILIVTDISWNF